MSILKSVFKSKGYLLPLIAAVVSGSGIILHYRMSTADIFGLIILGFLFYLYKKAYALEQNRKIDFVAKIEALFFSTAMVFSRISEEMLEKISGSIRIIWCFIAFYILFYALLKVIYHKVLPIKIIQGSRRKKNSAVKAFLAFTLVFGIAWMPFFLYVFPGHLTQDSFNQLMQAIGEYPLSDHHPVVHTMLIKLLFSLGMTISGNNVTFSLALYSICQMGFLAMSFSYCCATFYRYGMNKYIVGAAVFFYAVPAYHGFYSVEMWKDIWFAAFVTVFGVTLWRVIMKLKNKETLSCGVIILLALSGLGVCLFRSNGVLGFAFFMVFALIYAIKYNYKGLAILGVAVLGITLLIKGPVYNAMGVKRADFLESIAIPIQQVAAVIAEGKPLTEEEYELINSAVDITIIPQMYDKGDVDPVKYFIREKNGQECIAQHKKQFFDLWFTIGCRYPAAYFCAYLNQTDGYWNPAVQGGVYYPICGTFQNPFEHSMISAEMQLLLGAYSEAYRGIPYWGLLWSIGAMVWCMFFLLGIVYIKGNRAVELLFLTNIGVWITLMIAVPTNAVFRYLYCLFTLMPLLVVAPFWEHQRGMAEAKNNKVIDTNNG